MNSIFKVNTELALFDYLVLVQEIAYEFINEETGAYQPHIGKLNAMRLFYNYCVVESKFDEKYAHNVTDADSMIEIVADEDFINAFNSAIKHDGKTIKYDFANAYKDALEIVDIKKTSFGTILNMVNSTFENIKDKISPLLTKENMDVFSKIAKDVLEGKTSAEAVVSAYTKKSNLDKTGDEK